MNGNMEIYFFPSCEQTHKGRIYQFALRNGIKHSQLFEGVALQVTSLSKEYISKQLRLNRIQYNEFVILKEVTDIGKQKTRK